MSEIKNIGDGLKGINFDAWGGVENFLRETSTGAGGTTKPQLLRRVNPWLAKAQDMTAIAVSELPFDILNDSGDVVDTSSDWKNKLGGIPSPKKLMYNLASSLCFGRAYVIPQYTSRMITDLHYCAPHTVVPLITTGGLQRFSRTSDFGESGTYYPAGNDEQTGYSGEMMYFWLSDSDVEIGPAKSYPAAAALLPAELITAMDGTLQIISERGFVPPTILAVKGMVGQGEREKTEAWYNRFLRRWNETVAKLINAETMDIKQIGAGMAELKTIYSELKKQAIEDIGTSYGIPAAIFMSDMAFASEVNPLIKVWYSTSVFMKIYQTIEDTFNTQLLNRFGLRLAFDPNQLDAFQEDETKRAAAYVQYVRDGQMRPSLAAEMLGLDLPNGQEFSILDEKFDKGLATPAPVIPPPANVTQEVAPQDNAPKDKVQKVKLDANQIKDLATWSDMAKRFYNKGKSLPVDFECKALPEDMAAPIRHKLQAAQNELDIVKAFEIGETMTDAPEYKSEILLLAEAINNAANSTTS